MEKINPMALAEIQHLIELENSMIRIKCLVGNEAGDTLHPLILEAAATTGRSVSDIAGSIEYEAIWGADFYEVKTVDDLYTVLNITAAQRLAYQWDLLKTGILKQSRFLQIAYAVLDFLNRLISKAKHWGVK